jgi:hypothetical protein
MFKQTIEYNDFNGNARTEDFYFHLFTHEVTRIEAEIGKKLEDHTKDLVASGDLKELLDFLERIILNSYGKKTTDGRSFHKSPELRREFEYSNAYAELFEKFLTDPELARKFGEGVGDNGKTKKNVVEPTVVQG